MTTASAEYKKNLLENLSKQYDPACVEPRRFAKWEADKVFHSTTDMPGKPYTIVIPPPNVTGILHMGHALNNTLQDILIRHARMKGKNALWIPGTDHAGIATQNVVERALAAEGQHREQIGREAFIEKVWDWKEKYGSSIVNQLKRLGCSCDWDRERFTMDPGLSRAVRSVFVRLYRDGLIYRGRRLINWCVRCHTALADDEIEHETKAGKLWHIRYPLKDGRHSVVVATTRPETMLGDTAVAVHPEDERYREFIGQKVILPVMGREIPVIADEMVDRQFGTGVVKITPAHDPNDYECGLRHKLEQIVVIGPDGRMTAEAGKYAGLDRFRCRERLVEELEQSGALVKVEEHQHAVGQCYRCDSVVEPHLSEQWFVRMRPLADKAIEASRNKEVAFYPARWEKVYLSWLENVRDWCISRQIWWGHRIPVWYCQACGETVVEETDPTACPKCQGALEQDPDVLDTWFSSGLWPFSTLGWPEETADLKYYYPTETLVTARDIIYFWVARMVMMGLHFMGEVPFRKVYINGTILDEHGARMSKSREIGIDPIVLIQGGVQRRFGKDFTYEAYGADAVRFTLCTLTTDGQDIRLSPTRFEMGRNFINKLWNAGKFVLYKLSDVDGGTDPVPDADLAFEDRWILSRVEATAAAADAALEGFHFHEYARTVYEFAWGDFCDWYLEMVKPRLAPGAPEATARAAARTLAWTLDRLLRLLHPAIPSFSEEMWDLLGKFAPARGLATASPAAPSLAGFHNGWSLPDGEPSRRDEAMEESMARVQDVVRAVRNIRAKFKLSNRTPLSAVVVVNKPEWEASLLDLAEVIKSQAGLERFEAGMSLAKPEPSAAEVLPGGSVFVPLAGLMDVGVEKLRIRKEMEKKEKALAALAIKLQNPEFLAKAPPAVVASEDARREELDRQLRELDELERSLG